MKKLLLTIAVIVVFALYSIYLRSSKTNNTAKASTNPITAQTTPAVTTASTQGKYKDGTYTGKAVDVFYGNIQVKAVIQNGAITDVQFMQYPNDQGESVQINTSAMPVLTQEAIQAQTSQVDIVSGATDSSQGFVQSLGSALSQAI